MDFWYKILIAFAAIQKVLSLSRLVVNTTCLELAKSSNQQFRLFCSNNDYHCLLDETFTKEFEVCREWKWIPGGKCAYFNTYGSGNVDERECKPRINLTCSESKQQFESNKNTRFTACYAKEPISTFLPTSSSPVQITPNMTSDGDIATPHPTFKAWIIFLPIIAVLLTICGIFFIHRYFGKTLCKKESQELSDGDKNDNTAEQQPFFKSETENTSKNQPTMRHEDETTTGAKRNETPQNDVNNEIRKNEGDSDKSAEFNNAGGLKEEETTADVQNINKGEENSTENALGLPIEKSDDGKNDKDESTDVFDDTFKSLEKAPTTDEQGRELCTELYNLLEGEGQKLTKEVMTAVISRETGKAVKTLLNNLKDQDKSELKRFLPEESHRILESKTEHDTSFHVLYGLNRIFLDEKHHPISGWGNPIWGKDIGVGDDVERLYRIQTIVCETSNPKTISVGGYVRLLDIMIKALPRLDPDAEFKKDYKALANKLTSIENPTLIQKVTKTVRWNKLWYK